MKPKKIAAFVLVLIMIFSMAPSAFASYSNNELVNFAGGTVYRNVGQSEGSVKKDPCQLYTTGQTYSYGGTLYYGIKYNPSYSRYGWVKESQLSKITYTVSYNANGGSGAPGSQTKYYNTTLTLSSTKPSRTGYSFSSWNTKSNGSGTTYGSGGSYSDNSDKTMFAIWTANKYTVSFNSNGGSSVSSKTVTYNSTYGTLTSPTRSGYSFQGWFTSSSGGSQVKSDTKVTITSNQTLYAHWKDSQAPSCSFSSTNNVAASQTVTINLSDNSGIAGYYWGTSSSYSNNTYTATSSKSFTKTVSSPGTYYLTAKDSTGNVSSTVSKTFYKTTLNANGGSATPASVLTASGSSFALPAAQRTNYTLKNWNTVSGGTGTAYSSGASFKPTGNTTLYAQWTDAVKPSATFGNVSNNVSTEQTVTVNATDNSGIAGYYWGTSSTYSNNTYYSVSGSPTSSSLSLKATAAGTYYLVIKDKAGNLSPAITKTFFKTTFNANGGSVSPAYVITLSGNSFSLPTPKYTGYTVQNWSNGSTAYSVGAAYKPTANVTLTAKWADKSGPSISSSCTNQFASSQTLSISASDVSGIVGYYWGTNSSYTGNSLYNVSNNPKSYSFNVSVSSQGTYYLTVKDAAGNVASTSFTFYRTTFDSTGGSAVSSVITLSGNTIVIPNSTKTNYKLKNWNTSSNGTGTSYSVSGSYKPSSTATLYAIWEDSVVPTAALTVTTNTAASQTATLTLSDNVGLSGYYWGTNSSYTGNTFTQLNSETSKTVTKTVSAAGTYYLTAKDVSGNVSRTVSVTLCKITLSAEGGSVSPASVVISSGTAFALPGATRSGYTFKGWNTSPDGKGTTYAKSASYTANSTTALYALWIDSSAPSVSIASTNDLSSTQTVTLIISDNESVAGYYWGTSSSYSDNSYFAVSGSEKNVMESKNITSAGYYYLTAKDKEGYVSTTASIRFVQTTLNAGEGSVTPSTILTKSGSSITLPTATSSGHVMKSWNTKSDGSGTDYLPKAKYTASSNTTLYVQWIDTTEPVSSMMSSSKTDDEQTVVINITDDLGILGYYWGKNSDYTKNSYYSVSGTPKSVRIEKTVNEAGTYYLTVIDTSGNISETQSITFYETVFEPNGGTVSVRKVISPAGTSFVLPSASKRGYDIYAWNTVSNGSGTNLALAADGVYTPALNAVLYAVWVDNEKPTATLSSTNNLSASQAVTIRMNDTVGVAGFYWGTNSTYSSNTYTGVTAAESVTASKTVTAGGTYYLTVKDVNGNLSFPVMITFYATTLSTEGTVSISKIVTPAGQGFTLPGSSQTGFEFICWNTYSNGSGASYAAGSIYVPNTSRTLYARWRDLVKPTISVSSSNGISDYQSVTVNMNDNYSVKGFYWGTSSSYQNNTFVSVSSAKSVISRIYISSAGTYYFTAADLDNNTSDTVSLKFYQTDFASTEGGTLEISRVLTESNSSFSLPGGEKEDFRLVGWSNTAGSTTEQYSKGAYYRPTANKTLYAVWKESIVPTASISSSNDLSTEQNVTLTLEDNSGLGGYYWGKNSDYTKNTYTPISGSPKQKVININVTSEGTYYLTVVDSAGNISKTETIMFYKTTLNAKGGICDVPYVITKSGDVFTLPSAEKDCYTMSKWSTVSDGSGTLCSVNSIYSPSGNSTLFAVYNTITYYADFVADGIVTASIPYTVETTMIVNPEFPSKAGYSGRWETYKIVPGGMTVNAIYSIIYYSVSFYADNNLVDSVQYTVDTISIKEPDIPQKEGYTAAWEDYEMNLRNIIVNAVYTPIEYKVEFVGYDVNEDKEVVIATDFYTVENKTVDIPDVPAKAGHASKWENFELNQGDKLVAAVYTPKSYKIHWVIDDGISMTDSYYCNDVISVPLEPQKRGYQFDGWSPVVYAVMKDYDVTYTAQWVLKTYTAEIVADGKVLGEVTFTYGDEISEMDLPAVPAKKGYTGKWEILFDEDDNPSVVAVYTPIAYHAVFIADGKVIGTVPFTVEDTAIQEPQVPKKAGYTNERWEKYTITASDITVNAIYDNSQGETGFKLPEMGEQFADYKTNVTVKFRLRNVPSGSTVYIDGSPVTPDANGYYSKNIGSLKADKDVAVKVMNGNTCLDSSSVHITVSTGFFAKLSSWFVNWLFNMFRWRSVDIIAG